jgi:hypothetical protein
VLKKIIENIKKSKIVVIFSGIIAALITTLFIIIGLRPRNKKNNAIVKETIREGEGTDEVISDINSNITAIDAIVNGSKERIF